MSASPMTVRLDAAIASATDPSTRGCLRTERAAYLARIGRGAAARAELDALQAGHAARPTARLSAALNLAEGIVARARGDVAAARDRLLRARALGTAAGLADLQAQATAWLAHLDAWRGDAVALKAGVAAALRDARADDHAVRCRAGLAVAHAAHRAGRLDRALPWYARARRHALADADEASVGELMYGMAWLRTERCRVDALRGIEPSGVGRQAWLAVESVASFDLRVGAAPRPVPVALLRARLLAAAGRWDEALVLYDADPAPAWGEADAGWRGDRLAERAWCRLRTGRPDAAADDAHAAEACLGPDAAPGDGAIAHERLAQVHEALGDTATAARHAALAHAAWSVQAALCTALLACVDAIEPAGSGETEPPGAADDAGSPSSAPRAERSHADAPGAAASGPG